MEAFNKATKRKKRSSIKMPKYELEDVEDYYYLLRSSSLA